MIMLKPDKDRLNYSDLLTPPAGYEVVFAAGTTYSLDLEALIGVPVALSLSEEMDQTFQEDPIYMLEGLRQTADHMAVFCEAGQIKVPKEGNSLFALMEDSVFEVALENERSFHPKLWLIKYQDKDRNVLHRLLVLSRNLTFDRSWDMALALEGEKQPKPTTKNQPLVDFLKFLVFQTPHHEKQQHLMDMIKELPYIHFQSGDKHVPDFQFHPLGIKGYDGEDIGLFESYHHLVIISPFLSEAIISELHENALSQATQVLITRRSELPKLTNELINAFDVYVLKDTIVEGEGAFSEESDAVDLSQLQDIHAKFYARSKHNQHLIYMGSANSSTNAFEGNVEFLLSMQYKKYGFKLHHLLEELFGDKEVDNPFEKIEHLPEEQEKEEDHKDQLQKAIKALCRTKSYAVVQKDNENYSIRLFFESLPEEVEFTIGSLLSKAVCEMKKETVIEQLSLLELGEFYRVTAETNGESIERIIKIPTRGIPSDREQAIYRKIIDNPVAFLQYVAFLLADDFLLAGLEQMEKKSMSAVDWSSQTGNYPILYENMLKAAARSPEKLEDIHHIIEMIDHDDIIPEQFFHLYETFSHATKGMKK